MTVQVGYGPSHDGTGLWEASVMHPTEMRFIRETGDNAEDCQSAFIDKYNVELGESLGSDDFNFVRNIKVTAEISQTPNGFLCLANPGDRPPVTTTEETEEEAKSAFITKWNNELGTNFEEIEFLFVPIF